jgi:protein-S-isoprenylcysteine O-methyltransferase Ste14
MRSRPTHRTRRKWLVILAVGGVFGVLVAFSSGPWWPSIFGAGAVMAASLLDVWWERRNNGKE